MHDGGGVGAGGVRRPMRRRSGNARISGDVNQQSDGVGQMAGGAMALDPALAGSWQTRWRVMCARVRQPADRVARRWATADAQRRVVRTCPSRGGNGGRSGNARRRHAGRAACWWQGPVRTPAGGPMPVGAAERMPRAGRIGSASGIFPARAKNGPGSLTRGGWSSEMDETCGMAVMAAACVSAEAPRAVEPAPAAGTQRWNGN